AQQEQSPGGTVPPPGRWQFGQGSSMNMSHRRSSWIAFTTILTKEVRRFTRIWPQTLLPPGITMALYFVIFGNLIGRRIGEMDGFAYIDYIVPGLIMMSVITNSYSNVVSSFFSTKFQRSIEELMVAPVSPHVILLGYSRSEERRVGKEGGSRWWRDVSSRRRHTRFSRDWSSDVCSSDLIGEMDGFAYIDYIVPGLIMMSVITNSYSNVVSSFFSTKFQRSIEELMVAPVSPHVILLGYS